MHLLHGAIYGGAVAVDVKYVHKDADEERVAVGLGVAHFCDFDDAPVGGAQYGVGLCGDGAGWVAEELHDKGCYQPQGQGCPDAVCGSDACG